MVNKVVRLSIIRPALKRAFCGYCRIKFGLAEVTLDRGGVQVHKHCASAIDQEAGIVEAPRPRVVKEAVG